jgi:hypothetical protein
LIPESGESEARIFLVTRQHYWFNVENSKRKGDVKNVSKIINKSKQDGM